ncbi:MAG: L,D-transpeptidase [Sandaracinus sp.]|nr:L,D-transpeptidase [Sandaracinus sp.]MCB9615112.1 L,D-transpeptidase [Sandaracinus sp.]
MRRWLLPTSGALLIGLVAAVVVARSDTLPETLGRTTELPAPPPAAPDEAPLPVEQVVLRAPEVPARATPLPYEVPTSELVATAYYLDAPIFDHPGREPEVMGLLRRGRALEVTERAYGAGCPEGGAWYRLAAGGYACTKLGFFVTSSPVERAQRHVSPDTHLPYRYAAVRRGIGALRLHRRPHADERAKLDALRADPEAEKPEVVDLRMEGDYFVAIDDEEDGWVRTVRGRYLRAADLDETPTSRLVGSTLGELRLPLAFVYGEMRPLHRIEEGVVNEVGEAEPYARFTVRARPEVSGARYVANDEGLALLRDHVRVARRITRPERVPPGARWIHVDLGEQTLVAYEGDRPVYATLVATGREGYETPRGTFRIREKHVGATMRGEDPVDGPYEVEEVPWTQYYWRSYAIHGAYWHDGFGQVRSHGCTNLAPADARHLFGWTSPKFPDGWHARRLRPGTWLHFTR